MSFAAMMVHLDVERDCEQRVQLALDLADRFQTALIGIAGLALRPAFAAGGVVVYGEPTEQDYRALTARFHEMGRKFLTQGQHLKQVEWRTALELRYDLVAPEARAADLVIVGPRHMGAPSHDLAEPGDMDTVVWVSGSSAGSRTSFSRRAQYAACCRIEISRYPNSWN